MDMSMQAQDGSRSSGDPIINRYVTFSGLGLDQKFGRLGNQLFQIAATIGTAVRNQCPYTFPSWKYAECFQEPLPRAKQPLSPVASYSEKAFYYQPITINRPTSLAHCEKEIRRVFTFHPGISQRLSVLFGRFYRGRACSVHVRRTDYLRNRNYQNLTSTSYYDEAMRRFDGDTTFLVFSDDIHWCKERLKGKKIIFIEGTCEIEDLFLMSQCHSHIIANSSFSWWGAWLNSNPDKTVVAPGRWFAGDFDNAALRFRPGPPHKGYHDTKDLLPESWNKMEIHTLE